MIKPSITCVNIFGFLDFTDDLVDMTGLSSHFFSWFEITELLVLSEITVTGFDLSSDVFAAPGEVLMWTGCTVVVVVVEIHSVTATVVGAMVTTVVTTGTETELVDGAAMDDVVVCGTALTTAVTELDDDW